ncbi:MAG: UDP-3-O-acyl-N-acetylglucosamine deacetylase [Proteobacteria bacterium]|nr:UDP-3-O-acyl-N-acetylglucosamine deacetylase [Pseudomonadota bacterium]
MGSSNGLGGGVLRQRTLKNSIHCSGIGLHSGVKVNMTLHPAEANTGIRFRRNGTVNGAQVAATWENVVETPLSTTLIGDDDVKAGTIEHLMSALAGCAVDNAVVELSGPEVPVMDGSAAPFVFLIECAGTVAQDAPRRALEILKEVAVADTRRSATVSPGRGLSIDFEIDFDSPVVARQSWSLQVTPASYKQDVSRARTFGFLEEVDKLREMGLALGGSLDNAVVINGDHILNDGGLRYGNEFVRHKVLDLIGDLYLTGAPVIGRFRCVRSGHAMTLRMLKALFADREAWRWRDMTEADVEVPMGASVPPARAVAARA